MLFAARLARFQDLRVAAGLCITLLIASDAGAQSSDWSDRAFLNVNMAQQVTARPFTETLTPVINAERAVLDAEHPGEGARLAIEAGGGVRFWRNLGIGVTYAQYGKGEALTVRAIVPHPVLFNQPRAATNVAVFERAERTIHADAVFMIPVTPRMDIAVSAGPSFIAVQQDLIQGIEVAEAGAPFTSVAIGNVAMLTRNVHTLGAHGAVDVTWFLTPTAGIGFTARYVSGSAATQLSDGTAIDLDVGGFQIGWGARLRLR